MELSPVLVLNAAHPAFGGSSESEPDVRVYRRFFHRAVNMNASTLISFFTTFLWILIQSFMAVQSELTHGTFQNKNVSR